MKEKPLAVVLASGGMDSCVAAAVAAREYRLAFLHVCYGQRTEQRELRSFKAIADYYNSVERLVLSFDFLGKIGGSSLTDRSLSVPPGNLHRAEIPSTYVPFRNSLFLSAAVSWAEVLGASAVVVGAVEEDSSGYPDCRREFFVAFNRVISTGTKTGSRLRIETPVIDLSKEEIVTLGASLKVPFQLTWSCYQEEEMACGTCDSCMLRRKGFAGAGIPDGISYAEQTVSSKTT
ncbi:MAG: 7-cyano-7-deazaguanine synthase QueC [Ignavibacteria bacterium]|nr:7-cyano-7-deazaguanine synthase QueC [Ignavibacteria bacterium]